MQDMFIRGVRLSTRDETTYPYNIPSVRNFEAVEFDAPITFFVGENGSGKSTLIESIAIAAGFNAEGGTKNYHYSTLDSTSPLSETITLVRGSRREKYGYFLRAESFYTTANYAETGTYSLYGPSAILFNGTHIHEQSHGEAFFSIVQSFRPGLFIFDEPESALSPQRQLALMAAMHTLVQQGSQFIIATHSPILLAYPAANIYALSLDGIEKSRYEDIEHVTLTRDFLNNPSQYLRNLLDLSR